MSDNVNNLMSDSKSDTSHVSRMGISPDFHLPHIDHDHMEPEVIVLFDGSDSKGVFEDSLEGGTSPSDSLEVLLSNIVGDVNRVEVSMSPLISIDKKIQVNQ